MTTRQFFADTVEWLRTEKQLRSEVAPTHKIEDERGIGRIHGFFAAASTAGRWAMRGLWAIALGAMLAMTALPGVARATQVAMQGAGYAGQAAGVACLAAAEANRRRHRKRAVVEVRAAEAGLATAEDIAALGDDARGAEAWLVTEVGLEPSARARANERGVRCFIGEGGRFREVSLDQNDSGSSSPPVK
jgi:hypothetical protein